MVRAKTMAQSAVMRCHRETVTTELPMILSHGTHGWLITSIMKALEPDVRGGERVARNAVLHN